jgi:redox-sensitive bicupin YhaK (pirin superfamily)
MDNGVKVKIICGRVNGVEGPVKDIVIDPEYIDVAMPADASFSHPTKTGHTVFAYVIEGEGYFDKGKDSYAYEVEGVNYFDFKRECLVGATNLVIFHDGDQVLVTTKDKPLRFLLISGKPIKEPVAWYGPIVMNTQQELKIAFEEYQNNTFIKHK